MQEYDITSDRDQKIVFGYIRIHQHCLFLNDFDVPKDINTSIFTFYHIAESERFEYYNMQNYQLSNHGMKVKRRGGGTVSVCYGSSEISSVDKGIYQWTFKIRKRTNNMAIGIDDTTYDREDYGSFNKRGKSKFYALWHDGYTNKWDNNGMIRGDDNSLRFDGNDLVRMILDLSSKTLSYKINNDDKQVVFKHIATSIGIKYTMAVYIHNAGDNIKFINCLALK